MTLSRGVVNTLLSVLGVLVLLGLIILIASFLSSNVPIKPILTQGLELRDATDPVTRAQLITDLDELVTAAESVDLSDQWDRMMQCLGTSCPNEAYLDFVLVTSATFETEIPNGALLINIIAAAKYWDSPENLLEFSKAVSLAEEQIDLLENKQARRDWNAVVECNGQCPEKFNLIFDLIKTIAK